MLPVSKAFMDAFTKSDLECELIESEREDQVHVLVNSETFGPRFLVVCFPKAGGYVSAMLPLVEIPKGKSHGGGDHRQRASPNLAPVKFWADKKKPDGLGLQIYTFVQEADAVAMTTDAVCLLMDYCDRVYHTFEKAFQNN